jgi:hypothetical protein
VITAVAKPKGQSPNAAFIATTSSTWEASESSIFRHG